MLKRLLLGPILIAVVLLLAWLDERIDHALLPGEAGAEGRTYPPGLILAPLCIVLAGGAALELARMIRAKGVEASRFVTPLAAIGGMLACCTALIDGISAAAIATAGAFALLASQTYYSRDRSVQGILAAAAGAMLAFVYLGLMFGCLILIRAEHPVWMLVWAFLTTKSSDIGAYFTGKAFGQHKLILWLSPGKTWEGLIGGIVFAGLVGMGGLWVVNRLTEIPTPAPWTGMIAGMLFATFGQLGDLGESLFKRDAGIKDSGRSLPGFGGLLDVLDSLILVGPIAYWWLRLVDAGTT
ncbi:MAG: phosphatidate cytidylyltransferase [Phycisphaerales bacterium]|nr:phosphatidate cytidylyltransferase [Phycisphaerales bacterium]